MRTKGLIKDLKVEYDGKLGKNINVTINTYIDSEEKRISEGKCCNEK